MMGGKGGLPKTVLGGGGEGVDGELFRLPWGQDEGNKT